MGVSYVYLPHNTQKPGVSETSRKEFLDLRQYKFSLLSFPPKENEKEKATFRPPQQEVRHCASHV